MSNFVAIVKSLVGQVFAVSFDGFKRQVFEGERLHQGEQLMTSLGGEATLQLANGALVQLSENSAWQAGEAEPQAEQVATDPTLEQALAAGLDPTVDLEAPAAGPGAAGGAGGAAGGGHSFVLLDETGQQLETPIGFETQGLGFANEGLDEELGAVDENTNANIQANSPPVARPDSFALNEDGSVSIDVLSNDSDLDGDSLSITAVDGQAIAEGSSVNVGNGLVTLSGGQLVFTPAPDYNGPVDFSYTISDGVLSSTTTVSGTIAPINDAPLAVNDGLIAVTEDTAAIGNVLGNDSDPENDTLSVTQFTVAGDSTTYGPGSTATIPGVGTLLISANGNFTFTPAANYTGPVPSATYTLSDGSLTDTATLSFADVSPVNDAPLAVNDGPIAVTEDTAAIGNVLGNDSDPENDALSVTQFTVAGDSTIYGPGSTATIPGVGTLLISANGNFTFTPAANYTGPVPSATYTLSDGSLTDTATLSFADVSPVNDAPLAVNDGPITVTEDTTAIGNVLGNDSDPENDALSVTQFTVAGDSTIYGPGSTATIPGVGTLLISANGNFTFTPAANYTGPVPSATYTLSDGNLTDTATLSFADVSPVNDAPVAVADAFTLNEDETLTVTSAAGVLANDSDSENDALTASLVSGPAQGSLTLNADGSFSYTPTPNWSGSDSFTYRTFDGTDYSSPVTVALTVVPVADTPTLQLNGSRVLASTDFESAALNGASWSANVGAASLNNGLGSTWQTDNPSGLIEVGRQSVYMGGSSTNKVIELERNSGDASNLFTNVTAKAGSTYSLDFDYSARNGSLTTSDIGVYWDGNLIGTLTTGAVGFTSHHFDLAVPADGTYKLEFRAVDSNSRGGLLDNIVLSDVRNAGNEDSWIRLSDISANLTDTDGSETLRITIDALPAGSFLKDNNGNLFEATGSNVADITGWDKSTLSFLPPPNYNGVLTLNVTATATETANNDQAATSTALNVTINPVNDGPVATNDVVTPASIRSGLHADFYNYREGAVASGFDGPNMASIGQAEAFTGSSQPNAIFVASSLSFTPTPDHLGSGAQLETFLGSDASSLVELNRLSTVDAVVHMRGQINLAAGTYNFRINADDGYIIRINGVAVASLNGTNTDNTTTHSSFTIASGGMQDIDIVYYDQGGFARFNAELRSNGTDPYEPVTSSMLSHSPALYGGVETYSISSAELLANDSDADSGDVLSITAVSGAIGGTVSLSADLSTVTFVREVGFTGTPSFTYTVTDSAGANSSAQVQINPTSTLISGSAAADILIGDADDNLIMGLAGSDALTGGGGSDTFIWLKGHTGNDTISDFSTSTDLGQRDRIDLRDLLQGENAGNIDNYLRVVSTPLESSLQISTNGQFNAGGSADVTIKLENGGAPVDLSSYGATSSAIVNSLIAGADPLVKVDHT